MRSTPEHRRRKRRALAVALVAAAGLAVWTAVGFASSGGERAASEPGNAQPGNAQPSGADGRPEPVAGTEREKPRQSAPDPDSRNTDRRDAPGSKRSPRVSPPENAPREPGERAGAGLGEAPADARADAEVDESSGTGKTRKGDAERPEPTANRFATERVRSAAGRFVGATFGYSGDSTEDYTLEIEKAALMQGVSRSPAGRVIDAYEQEIESGGVTSAAVMDHFRVTSKQPSQVKGIAYFRVGDSYDDTYADIEGSYVPFSQRMTLCPSYSTYEVCSAEVHREIEGDYPYYQTGEDDQ